MGIYGQPCDFQDVMLHCRSNRPYVLIRQGGQHFLYSPDGLPRQFLRLMAASGASARSPFWQDATRAAANRALYRETLSAVLPAADAPLSSYTQ
jgi:hypothetical protein